MDTKRRHKKKPKSTKKAIRKDEEQANTREPQQDDGPDYGGLPKRDLKKNLGCG